MNIAMLICVYRGDDAQYFDDMFRSISQLNIPLTINLRVYLHIDGEISTDLEKIVKKYPVYKTIRSATNVGLAHGLNKLINVREDEEYFFRMDADDLVAPERIVKQLEFMESNPGVDLSGGGITEFNHSPSNIVTMRSYPNENLEEKMTRGSPFAHVTVCFRKSFFDDYGLYPTNFPLNEDIAYWFHALKIGAVGRNIDDILVNVRMDDAYNRRSLKKSLGEFKIYMQIAKWQKKGYIYAVLRLCFRLFPTPLVGLVYNSKFRRMMLNKS